MEKFEIQNKMTFLYNRKLLHVTTIFQIRYSQKTNYVNGKKKTINLDDLLQIYEKYTYLLRRVQMLFFFSDFS